MSQLAGYDEESESRTAIVGLKHNHSGHQGPGQVHSHSHSHAHSRDESESSSRRDSPTMDSTVSRPTEAPNLHNPEPFASLYGQSEKPILGSSSSTLGNNRLATGFAKRLTVLAPEPQSTADSHNSPSSVDSSSGASANDAIEISDDEQEESSDGGGMVINIDNPSYGDESEDMDVDAEEGEVSPAQEASNKSRSVTRETTPPLSSTGQAAHLQLQGDLDQVINNATNPKDMHLADLDTDQLEVQLKYAFFDVNRDQVDLNRPARCLGCLQEGHAEQDCPEKKCTYCAAVGQHSSRRCPLIGRCSLCREQGHNADSCTADLKVTTVPCDLCGTFNHVEEACPQRFFPRGAHVLKSPIELWISCCCCASKSHLVGDCPDVDQAAAARWSLKDFDPSQLVNLTLHSSTKDREKIAANRGLRPEGLQIRGRAGLHNAGVHKSALQSDNDSDEQFLGPRVGGRENVNRGNFTFRHPKRLPDAPSMEARRDPYDRYDAPTDHRSYQGRPPNDWYATDSFGHRRSRSRSPPRGSGRNSGRLDRRNDPDDMRRRSRSPRGFNGYKSDRRRSQSPRILGTSRPVSGFRGSDASNQLNPGVSVQLPMRRGSNALPKQSPSASLSQTAARLPQDKTSNEANSARSIKKKSKKGKANATTRRA